MKNLDQGLDLNLVLRIQVDQVQPAFEPNFSSLIPAIILFKRQVNRQF